MTRNLIILVLMSAALILVADFIISKTIGKLIYPVRGRITSPFGNRKHPVTGVSNSFHNGIDIAAASGTSVKAAASGTVTKRYYHENGGNSIVIAHDNGFTSGYAHLSSFSVKIGDRVKQGQEIGKSGATGRVTAAHLHFTLRNPSGDYVNPEKYLS